MNDARESKNEAVLDCYVDDDKIIYITLGGDVSLNSSFQVEKFETWVKKVKQAMQEVSVINSRQVLTLIDVTQLKHFDVLAIERLRELMAFNKDYATKTAVFGASMFIRTVVRSTLALTHRTTMKLFPTRADALVWLTETEERENRRTIG